MLKEVIEVSLGERSYPIYIGDGLIGKANDLFGFKGRALILTDSGVPREYAEAVCGSLSCEARIFTVKEGEGAKSLSVLEEVLTAAAEMKLTRQDAIIAVGGGVVGDLGGFAAATYMRGIAFYNIPTTMLAMVDSSVGGKTAVNLCGIKNIVGAFHQPRGVLIDTDTLKTLDGRQISAGLCEAVKMAATLDGEEFDRLARAHDREDIMREIASVISRALCLKRSVVEKDECEAGLRKLLNFGHTIGHGIEAESEGRLYHGECVALGMLPFCSEEVKAQLLPVLRMLELPTKYDGNIERAAELATHDKKAVADKIDAVFVDKIGEAVIRKIGVGELLALAKSAYGAK